MKTKRNRKPTNQDLRNIIGDIQYRLMATQSQLNALMETFSDFLDYTGKKAKFIKYMEKMQDKKNKAKEEEN